MRIRSDLKKKEHADMIGFKGRPPKGEGALWRFCRGKKCNKGIKRDLERQVKDRDGLSQRKATPKILVGQEAYPPA